ncbi:MAG TPA: NBR1-Ig-like domain-containing protein [Anaerolineales bacterium]
MPSATYTPTASSTPVPCNAARFISDVTIPDGWEATPSDHFTKTWRLQNAGSCTWTSGYSLVFDHGDQLGAPATQQLTPGTVAPGGTVDVSVDLISPVTTGTYQGFFKLRASDSSLFGIGPAANDAFWVKIKVTTPTLIPPVIAPTVQQITSSITLTPGSTGSTTAACPAGMVATGGGFSVGADILVYTQAKNGNGWTAVAKNNAAVNRPMVVYAECLTYPSASAVQVNNSIMVSPSSFASQTAVCPAGSIVTGGGYTSSPDGAMWTYASWQNGNGWEVSEMNTVGSAKTFNVYATCLSGVPLATAKINNTGTIPASGDGFVEVACPAGKVATGGGFGLGTNTLPYFSGFSSGYWRVYVHNSNASVASLLTTVTCLG